MIPKYPIEITPIEVIQDEGNLQMNLMLIIKIITKVKATIYINIPA
jgi:hypothetical protein